MRILILGRTEYLYDTALLLSKHHAIAGIITAAASPEYSKNEDDFEKLAAKLGSEYHFTNTITPKTVELITALNADICVSLNWKSVLKEDVISLFPRGILNAHFGDLPSYRGNAVINWAIINNEPQIAVSVHQMVPGEIDSGPVYKKVYMPLNENTTIGDITRFCHENTPKLFLEAVNSIEAGTAVPEAQDKMKQKPFRCYPRLPEYSRVDWSRPAREIHSIIRASSKPYSGAYSYLKIDGVIKKVFLWKSAVASENTGDIAVPGHIIKNDPVTGFSDVFTGSGIITIQEAQYEDGEPFMPGKEWKSIRMHFGIDIEEELINLHKLIENTGKKK